MNNGDRLITLKEMNRIIPAYMRTGGFDKYWNHSFTEFTPPPLIECRVGCDDKTGEQKLIIIPRGNITINEYDREMKKLIPTIEVKGKDNE